MSGDCNQKKEPIEAVERRGQDVLEGTPASVGQVEEGLAEKIERNAEDSGGAVAKMERGGF